MEAALGQSSENADRTLLAGGQVKHTPSTGPQAQIRAPAAHREHRNGLNPAELPERRPTSGQMPRPRKTLCTSSESPARGVQARPRRLQTQRQLVPPGLGDTKEGGRLGQGEPGPSHWREESPPAAWKPGASGVTGVLSRWSAATQGVLERLTVRPPPNTPRPMGPEDLHFLLLPSGRFGQQFHPDEQEGQLGRDC